jgi:hypothetical protein
MIPRGRLFWLVAVLLSACVPPGLSPTTTPPTAPTTPAFEPTTINSRQAATEAMEDFLLSETGTSPGDYEIRFEQTGPLADTYIASVQRKDCSLCVARYLIAPSGEIMPLSLDQLIQAYRREGISVSTHGGMEDIAIGLIELNDNRGVVVVSSLNDIPGYDSHPLDGDLEEVIRAPWTHEDEQGATYWVAYTYTQNNGLVRRYRVAFRGGRIANPTEVWVLGRDIGAAFYPE